MQKCVNQICGCDVILEVCVPCACTGSAVMTSTAYRGRPMRRYVDVKRKDMEVVGVMGEDAEDKGTWKGLIHSGYPYRNSFVVEFIVSGH